MSRKEFRFLARSIGHAGACSHEGLVDAELAIVNAGSMAKRSGSADLPLHGGSVPVWLATRMAALGRVICEAIVIHYGPNELLRRLAHPFWFQSFGAVMGMDWHSSGITTSVIGALKRGLVPVQDELGLYVCGGRGRHSRKTPSELIALGERIGVNASTLVRASRLVAKVDSAAVQDGFELYLHAFITTRNGDWCVVQQGMSAELRQARRYHWLSEDLGSFVDAPHSAIDGPNRGVIVNLTDARAERARDAQLELVQGGPDRVLASLRRLRRHPNAALELFAEPTAEPEPDIASAPLPHLHMPAHHDVRASDLVMRRLHAALTAAADGGVRDFPELLLTPGVGARTVASLALVAEVLHAAPSRFSDPARFSMAHGGKDGHPFPVPLRVYDETVRVLKQAVEAAKLGLDDKLHALRRLDDQARALEAGASGPTFEQHVAREREQSSQLGGRTVGRPFDSGRKATTTRTRMNTQAPEQLRLPGLRRRS